jgi:serine/threonine protein kinase
VIVNLENVGPFRILKRLGTKRQRVFSAQHEAEDRTSAIKIISLPPDVSREEALKRIHKEIRFLNRLNHPNLVKVLGGGASNEKIYIEMELVPGESLASLLSRRGRLAWDLAVEYGIHIAEVLEYLHQKELLHSKLTPEKILIHEGQVKVTDLRLNRSRRRRWDDRPRAELDVAAYLAPEQLLGQGASVQADLYSLGVILYEMVTGQLPHPPESLREMAVRKQSQPAPLLSQSVVEVPTWLDQVVANLMHPDPNRRYPSALAALLALREIQKIDAQKISAVAQMAGGFNPLTAGADKREARLLLGRPDTSIVTTKKKVPLKIPAWATVSALLVGLVVCSTIIALTVSSLIPTYDSKIQQAHRILALAEPSIMELRTATDDLNHLLQRDPGAEQADEARQLVDELSTRRLLRLAAGGRVGNREGPTRDFVQAYQAAEDEKLVSSLQGFRKVAAELIAADQKHDYMYRETNRQIGLVSERFIQQAQRELEKAAAAEDRSTGSVWATDVKRVLGNEPDHAAWIAELTRQYPEIELVEAWPALEPEVEADAADSLSEDPAGSPSQNSGPAQNSAPAQDSATSSDHSPASAGSL